MSNQNVVWNKAMEGCERTCDCTQGVQGTTSPKLLASFAVNQKTPSEFNPSINSNGGRGTIERA